MKPVLSLPAVALCISAVLNAQHATRVPVVNADGPTIVAFFPNAPKIGSDGTDGNEALSDFEYYAERVKNPFNRLGFNSPYYPIVHFVFVRIKKPPYCAEE
jgi:hypothetical protein